jgi:dTDP-4-dehydrorhamnose reductase
MARLIVFGTGQLGSELARTPLPPGWTVECLSSTEADITAARAVESTLSRFPDATAVVNAAAYTAVDRAETEPDAAFAVNAHGPGILSRACARRGLPFIHVSSDYVFDGSHRADGWREEDPVSPLNVYGRSKMEGELEALSTGARATVLRTSWMFSAFGSNFVKTMLRLAAERPVVKVVNDQTGKPTSAASLAATVVAIAACQTADATAPNGLFHVADLEEATWFEFARAIFDGARRRGRTVPDVLPVATAEFPLPARRPAYSVLDTRRVEEAFAITPASWRDRLEQCLDELIGPEVVR